MTASRTPSTTRFHTTTALVASAAAFAVSGVTLMDRPLSARSFPAGVGPTGPAAAAIPFAPVRRPGRLVRSAKATVVRTAQDPIGATDRVADEAVRTVRTVRDDALHRVDTTVTTTVSTAKHTVASALDSVGQVTATAQRTVDAVGTTAAETITLAEGIALDQVATALRVARTVAGEATSLVISLTKVTASAEVDALNGTGTITVSAGDAVLAAVALEHGRATVTVTGPILGTTQLTITYGGDRLLAPSATVL